MTNREILQKAIEKAKNNGYNSELLKRDVFLSEWYIEDNFIDNSVGWLHINSILFNHDFAKAFWGTHKKYIQSNDDGWSKESSYQRLGKPEAWQFYLQQMVLEDEPLKYVERFLDD